MPSDGETKSNRHAVRRIRREPRRRLARVGSTERLTATMLRITFRSDDLRDFESAAPDDHVKLFVPAADGGEPAMRDYTPRSFNVAAGELVIDFALHQAGPATLWAMNARPGDALQIGGPRGSAVVTDDFDWHLLIGDETALPAIARRLEELRPEAETTTLVVVDGEADRYPLPARPGLTQRWIHRDHTSGSDAERLQAALPAILPTSGEGYVWIAAEGAVARTLRAHVIDTLGHPRAWTKAAGYWAKGEAGRHERLDD